MDDLARFPEDLPGGKNLSGDDIANPCGLIAKSFFNDTFAMFTFNGDPITIDEEDIAWESDVDKKFSRLDDDWQKDQWLDVENGIIYLEHFIVWMRVSGLPNFRKLWGKIDQDLDKGTYRVVIDSKYSVSEFDVEKYVVISTVNSLGGKNEFLGIAYIVVGAISLALAIVFLVKGCAFKNKTN